jgi:hypothetical protein
MELQIGELFMLGFRGPRIPEWAHKRTVHRGCSRRSIIAD